MFDENETVITEINDTIGAQDYKNNIRRKEWERKMGIDSESRAIHVPHTFPLGALIEFCTERGFTVWRDDDGSYHIEHCSMLAKQTG